MTSQQSTSFIDISSRIQQLKKRNLQAITITQFNQTILEKQRAQGIIGNKLCDPSTILPKHYNPYEQIGYQKKNTQAQGKQNQLINQNIDHFTKLEKLCDQFIQKIPQKDSGYSKSGVPTKGIPVLSSDSMRSNSNDMKKRIMQTHFKAALRHISKNKKEDNEKKVMLIPTILQRQIIASNENHNHKKSMMQNQNTTSEEKLTTQDSLDKSLQPVKSRNIPKLDILSPKLVNSKEDKQLTPLKSNNERSDVQILRTGLKSHKINCRKIKVNALSNTRNRMGIFAPYQDESQKEPTNIKEQIISIKNSMSASVEGRKIEMQSQGKSNIKASIITSQKTNQALMQQQQSLSAEPSMPIIKTAYINSRMTSVKRSINIQKDINVQNITKYNSFMNKEVAIEYEGRSYGGDKIDLRPLSSSGSIKDNGKKSQNVKNKQKDQALFRKRYSSQIKKTHTNQDSQAQLAYDEVSSPEIKGQTQMNKPRMIKLTEVKREKAIIIQFEGILGTHNTDQIIFRHGIKDGLKQLKDELNGEVQIILFTMINRQIFTNKLLPSILNILRDDHRYLVDQILIVPKEKSYRLSIETQLNLFECKELIWVLPLGLEDQDIKICLKLNSQDDILFDKSSFPYNPLFDTIPYFKDDIEQIYMFFSSFQFSTDRAPSFISFSKTIQSLFFLGKIKFQTPIQHQNKHPYQEQKSQIINPSQGLVMMTMTKISPKNASKKFLKSINEVKLSQNQQNITKNHSWIKSFDMIKEHQILSLYGFDYNMNSYIQRNVKPPYQDLIKSPTVKRGQMNQVRQNPIFKEMKQRNEEIEKGINAYTKEYNDRRNKQFKLQLLNIQEEQESSKIKVLVFEGYLLEKYESHIVQLNE